MSSSGGYGQIIGMVLNRAGSEAERRESELESKALKKQANLASEEAERDALRTEQEGEQFQAKQKLSFLKSGVSLQGSPLLTLAETGEETGEQAAAIRRRGGAQRTFLRRQAQQARGRGRASVLKATAENIGTASESTGGFSGGFGSGG